MHKFKVGEVLEIIADRRTTMRSGPCRVVATLPFEGEYLQYRVKSVNEANERIVNERDLRKGAAEVDDENPQAGFLNMRIDKRRDR